MNKIKSVIVNDRFLETIAINLHDEAKVAREGHRFKKIVPALAFYCFTLESKLLTYGKAVFTKRSEYRSYTNATLYDKFVWLLNRLNTPEIDAIEKCKTVVADMVQFRNALTHSKNIKTEEERELIGIEKFDDRYVHVTSNDKDFMTLSTLEKLDGFYEAIYMLDKIWLIQGRLHFNGDTGSLLVNMSRAKVLDRDKDD